MNRYLRAAFFAISLLLSLHAFSQVVVNEVVSGNTSINTDEDGSYQDWVELYNNGPAAVNLNGYGLTDDGAQPYKWVFPNVSIPANGYILVWCSDKNRTTPGQPLHTNWKISGGGEAVTLTAPGNVTVDVAPATAIPSNQSLGRQPNGTGSFNIIALVTPAAQNPSAGSGGQLDPPTFSQQSGFFTTGFTLTLTSNEPGATILYTLDGSDPSAANLGGTTYNYKNSYPENPGQPFGPMLFRSFQTNTYGSALMVNDRTSQPNKISMTSSTFDFSPDYFPGVNIFKATVVRAKVIKAGFQDSPVVTKNYFVTPSGNTRFSLPVFSLSIDENKLFDYEDGIYVAGQIFDQFRTDFPTEPADYPIGNYTQKGSAFQRDGHLNYFVNGQEVLNQPIGVRVQGNYSRLYPSKSMNIYADQDGMAYKFFTDEPYTNFKRIVLKNSGSDFYNSFFKDALCSEMARYLHTQTEASQPVVTLVNGEYWGLLTIREKYDDEFFLRVHGIPKNQIELLENDGSAQYIEEGDNAHYLAMINYIENNSLVPQANYDYIRTQMDTESFMDYFITNIFIANEDWPGNNIVFWRKNTAYDPNAPYGSDGRWRWATHDMSSTMYDDHANILAVATEPNGPDFPNPEWSTLILRKLLENPSFKNDFISRFADVMNTSFLPSRVVSIINAMKAEIEPEMNEQIVRWKAPFDLDEWEYFVGERLHFANDRPNHQRQHIRAEFGIANNINATLNVSNAAHGYIKINTIDIQQGTPGITAANPYPWTGVYFSNIPVKLKAIAKPGYMFSHWTGASTATTDEITITTAASFSVTAVFIPASFSAEVSVPINFWYMNGAIPNDTPLTNLSSFYEVATDGVINFESAFAGYPYDATHPNWRKASMERRNKPTPINYRPEANGGNPYVAGNMRALQITQPFQDNGRENTMIFNLSTKDYKNIKFSFAAMDESAATGITIDYSVNAGAPVWITTGLASTSFTLVTNSFQLYEADFTTIASVNDNPNFKIRLRFTGPNMTESAGNRVTFNNIALDGVKLPLIYPSPNTYVTGTAITPLTPTVAASVTSYSVSPALPAGLSLDTTTGIISGTPTAVTPTNTYTVTATNAGGTASFGIVITVNAPIVAPSNLSYASPNIFTKGLSIGNLNPTVTGTVVSYSVSPALPSGLTLDSLTGIISGTPTAVTATATYTVTATNSGGSTTFGIVITVNDVAPGSLVYTSPNIFTVGQTISDLLPTISGDVISFSVTPALPSGLSLNTSTGVISGTPTAVTATATYTITATNSGGSTTFGIVITVNDVAPSSLTYTSPNVFTVGSMISNLNPTVTGSVVSYSVAPALPNGLSLNTSTGVISGTPTAVTATATYTVTATNSGGSTTFGIVITVNDVAPSSLTYTSPNVFTVGSMISNLNPTVTGSVVSYSVSPALPNGLSLNPTTGVISGTPNAVTSTATYTVTATNSGGTTTFGIVITVNDVAPNSLSYTSPNVFTVGSLISNLNPSVTGNVDSYSVSPSLPSGLNLNTSTGVISGTPNAVTATATYTVTATNTGGSTTFGVVITVNDVAPISLSYTSPNTFTVGNTITNLNPSVTGNVVSYSVSPALPNGLSLNPTTGVISGTPNAVTSTATYTVTATNSGGTTTFGIVITVNDVAPNSLSYTSPNVFTVGQTISELLPTISGDVISFSVSPALPSGLSLNPTTGVISGTPTAVTATATYTVTATNTGGSTTFGVVITVNDVAPGSLVYTSPNVFTVGSVISNLNPTVTGNVVSYSVSPSLPAGLVLNTSTGVISGTPTSVTPTATYTITASNTGGNTTFGIVITVNDVAPNSLVYTSPNTFTVGNTITNLNPSVTGNVVSYSVSPALPNGLSLNTSTGVISGTPTAVTSTATYTVTATNSGGSTTFGIVITVNDVAPSSLSYTSPNVFTVGQTISDLLPTTSGDVISFSVAPSLPSGLSLNTSTGVISGTPTSVTATATYTVTATNTGGSTTFGVVITVNDVAPISLSYTSPNTFTVGNTITNLNPSVTGNVVSYSVSPALPNGLSLNPTTGVISGTPNAVTSTATYTVTATNSGGTTTFGIVITVNDVAPNSLVYTSPNTFTVGNTITNLNPSVTGNVVSYSVSPSLPAGLSLNTSTGVISGTPTAVTATATYTVTATNSGGSTTFGVVITVNDVAPSSLTYTSPNVFTVGTVISNLNPSVTGTVVSYSVSPALPNGLSLNPTTGVISGTPTAVTATATYTVTATNTGGSTTFGVVITVNDVAPISLSYTSPNTFTVGNTITNLNPSVTGNVVSYSVSPALPNGLSLNPTTGVISGTPNAVTSTATYTVTATNSGGTTTFGIVITVNDVAPNSLSYTSPNVFTVGQTISELLPTISGDVISFSVSPSLPAGLSLNTSTGVISGTPTAVTATATYTVTATNTGGSTTFGIVITVNDVAPNSLSYTSPNVFTVGSVISNLNPTVTGNVVSYSVAPALPSGLSLNPTTGVISGTPTAVTATATYTVTATNTGGTTTFGIVITVNDVAPNSLVYTSPNTFTVGNTITNLNPSVTGNVVSYSVAPSLPAGLSLNTSTGVISGTPTAVTATATYTVTATNSGGSTTFGVVITVNDVAPSSLTYTSPNVFTVGSLISNLNPSVTGNVVSYSVAPSLPNGLVLNTSTGVISGTPTAVTATATYTVTATNTGGSTTFGIIITVNDVAPNSLVYTSPNTFTVGNTITNLNPSVTGNVVSYSVSPSLPAGLSLNTSTGVISGTPTAVTATATYTVTATNSGGSTTFGIIITVNDVAPSSLTYTSPNVFTVGSLISNLNPSVTGNVVSYSVAPSLPNGLVLNTSTGVISGTPTAVTATATYTVTATNSGGSTTFGVVITVNDVAPSSLTYTSPNVFTVGNLISNLNPSVTGNVVSYSVAPSLPNGLVLNTSTGVISGTPTAVTATATYTVTATNTGGTTTFGIVITVNDVAPNSLSYTSPNVFTVGSVITNLNPTVTGNVVSYSVSPSLPSGLNLNTSTGVISGTPTAVTATATYTVTATNTGGMVSFDIIITVNPAAPVDLAYPTPNVFTVDQTIGSLSPTVTGEDLTFAIAPELPVGLALDPASGVISGTPGVISPATIYTVTASNGSGSVSFALSIAVVDAAPTALNYTTPANFTTGQMIIPLVPTVVGNVTGFSVFPELPAGLAIDPVTGVISGTPTSATATATYTVTATNSGGSVTFDIEITVSDPLGTIDPVRFDFVVWPNPFADVINISGLSGEIEYVLLSMDGRRLEAGKTANAKLYFDRLPEGVYLLQITQDGQTETKKVIKKD